MIITPKQPRDDKTASRLSRLVPYMLRGKGRERCTWYIAGNLEGLDRPEDAGLAVDVMELLQEGNVRAKRNKTYHLVISFHPEDQRLTHAELEDVVRRAVRAAGLDERRARAWSMLSVLIGGINVARAMKSAKAAEEVAEAAKATAIRAAGRTRASASHRSSE